MGEARERVNWSHFIRRAHEVLEVKRLLTSSMTHDLARSLTVHRSLDGIRQRLGCMSNKDREAAG